MTPPRISLVFPFPDYKIGPLWPHDGYDFEARSDELTKMLKNSCPNLDFAPVSLHNLEETEDFLKLADGFDGFLVYFVAGGIAPLIMGIAPRIAKTRKPMILVDDIYSGQLFLYTYPRLKEARFPVIGVSSSEFIDVIKAVKLFNVIKKMKEAKILTILDKDLKTCYGAKDYQKCVTAIKELLGTEVVRTSEDEFMDKYLSKVSDEEAEAIVEKWVSKALKVIEPTHEDLIKSARLCVALRRLVKDAGADAVLIEAMFYYYDKTPDEAFKAYWPNKDPKNRPAYKYNPGCFPCLAYFELENEGIMGICEYDLDAAATTLLVHFLAEEMTGEGIPGFTSEPAVDLGKGWMIYAHCKASNRIFGPSGPENPFVIRSHGESRYSATASSLLPLNNDVTIARLDLLNKVLVIHGGRAVANVETLGAERACRTKLAVETDVEKIMENWMKKTKDWHRTVFYGDWRENLKNLGVLLGLEVFEEDRNSPC